ncbi:MAG: F0F1 ATP synthase subunit A [Bacteroidales bacterium]|nr:F0F1 ATP synthase subunit A [Bacteroidales bacterium]
MTYGKIRQLVAFAFFVVFFIFSPIFSQTAKAEEEEFNAGEYIMGHITDEYGWHITTFNEHSISVPLPIILFDNGGLVVFSSNKLHHGEKAYNGYAMGFTEETSGSIVKLGADYADYNGELEEGVTYPIDHVCKFDISITKNVCALFVSIILLCWIFLSVAKRYKEGPLKAPKGLQSLLEPLVLFVRDEVAIPSIGEDKYQKYFPYLLTLFFFILVNNLMGLIPIFPGGANVTGNIAVTAVLAIITFFITNISANKHYWKDIINAPGVPWWLKFPLPLMPIVEFIGVFTKPFVLMIRLFANITAGHIIVLGFLGLIFIFGAMSPAIGYAVSPVSIFFYLFMGLLELLVAFIQAFVFTLLSAIYIGMAIEEPHGEKKEEKAEIVIQ